MLKLDVLIAGSAMTIHALVVNERTEVQDYLAQLPLPARKKIVMIMNRLANGRGGGGIENFRRLDDRVFEFKEHMTNTRLFCFLHQGRVVVCTHARKKPGPRQLPAEIAKVKAFEARCRYEGLLDA
jgi:phage-related protein